MAKTEYDEMIFWRADPTHMKWECERCKEEVWGDEIDEDEVCYKCKEKEA